MLVVIGFSLLLWPKERLPDFYHPVFMGITAILSPFFIYAPFIRIMADTPRKWKLILRIRSVVTLAILMNVAGQLGLFQLYRFGFEYDKFTHFTVSMLFAYMLCEALTEWVRFDLRRTIVTASLIMFGAGIAWEGIEFSADMLFGTQEWGVYGKDTISDTLRDILFNTLGIFSGTVIFARTQNVKAEVSKKTRL